MIRTLRAAGAAALLALTACAAPAPAPTKGAFAERTGPAFAKAGPPPAETRQSPCRADDFAPLLGQPAAGLDRMILPAGARVLGPDDMATMDFAPERLNVLFGADGRVRELKCG